MIVRARVLLGQRWGPRVRCELLIGVNAADAFHGAPVVFAAASPLPQTAHAPPAIELAVAKILKYRDENKLEQRTF